MKIKIDYRKTFLQKQRKLVWEKAGVLENENPNFWRIDPCGACINWYEFGKRSKYGWNIDHILPRAKGGTDVILNFCVMHWKNNQSKADDFPKFKVAVSFNGTENVKCIKEVQWGVHTLEMLKKNHTYQINEYLEGKSIAVFRAKRQKNELEDADAGVKLSKMQKKILLIIAADKNIAQSEIAYKMNMKTATVNKKIKKLIQINVLERKEVDETGIWVIKNDNKGEKPRK